jgi:isoaspartyl peptidase/L-asparaginase-like protein (Ntn-hydrolase superfamily)
MIPYRQRIQGDIMMRFLPCYQAVENLRLGMSPKVAAEDAVARMLRKYPKVQRGIVVVNAKGEHGGAGSGVVRAVHVVSGVPFCVDKFNKGTVTLVQQCKGVAATEPP